MLPLWASALARAISSFPDFPPFPVFCRPFPNFPIFRFRDFPLFLALSCSFAGFDGRHMTRCVDDDAHFFVIAITGVAPDPDAAERSTVAAE